MTIKLQAGTLFAGGILGIMAGLSLAWCCGSFRTESEDWSKLPLAGATATASAQGSCLATGSFNDTNEILFYLDSQSGLLSAALLARSEQAFTKLYSRNIKADLTQTLSQLKIAAPVDARFIMVTGDADIRQVGAGEMNKVSRSFLYVAELNTGIVLVYAVPNEGARDLAITNGEIIFWTSARLNSGSVSQ